MNALDAACDYCHAAPGAPCLSVTGRVCVDPHMPRLDAAGVEVGDWSAAIQEYAKNVCELVLGTTSERVVRTARKYRSIDERAPWVRRLRVAQKAAASRQGDLFSTISRR